LQQVPVSIATLIHGEDPDAGGQQIGEHMALFSVTTE
jgi:hypothetical protein